jgi:hypothetical protein
MSSLKYSWRVRLILFAAAAGLGLLGGGCGKGGKAIPVSGKVTLSNGKTLTSGTVIFHPNKAKGNTYGGEPVGEINEQGQYTLADRGKPGAPAGWYKVTVASQNITPDNTKPDAVKSNINPTYSNPDLTTIEVEVVAEPKAYDIQVGP